MLGNACTCWQMELCHPLTLAHRLRLSSDECLYPDPRQRLELFCQLIDAVKFMHTREIGERHYLSIVFSLFLISHSLFALISLFSPIPYYLFWFLSRRLSLSTLPPLT
jgi:hypothetical protein